MFCFSSHHWQDLLVALQVSYKSRNWLPLLRIWVHPWVLMRSVLLVFLVLYDVVLFCFILCLVASVSGLSILQFSQTFIYLVCDISEMLLLVWFRFMVFNTTFNNISVISWQSVLLVEETGVPVENHWPAASHWQTLLNNVILIYIHVS